MCLEASASLVKFVNLSFSLVGAFLQGLFCTATQDVLVLEFAVSIADNGKDAGTHQQFFAQAVVGLDSVPTVFQEPAGRQLGEVAAGVALVNIENVLDFVDGKFRLVQEHQYLEAHLVGDGAEQIHGRSYRFAGHTPLI